MDKEKKAFKGMITAERKAEILHHRHRKKNCKECSQREQRTVRLKKREKVNSYDGNKKLLRREGGED